MNRRFVPAEGELNSTQFHSARHRLLTPGKKSARPIRSAWFAAFVALLIAHANPAIADSIGPSFDIDSTLPPGGTTAPPGKDTVDDRIRVHIKGGSKKGILVRVPIPKGTKDLDVKYTAIVKALQDAGFSASNLGNLNGTPNIPANQGAKGTIDSLTFRSRSGETDKATAVAFGGPIGGQIYYASTMSGKDVYGGDATYTASLGFDGFTASSFLTYSDLSSQTIDGLLTDTFASLEAQLPKALQGDLHLDLASQVVSFNFRPDEVNPFVSNGTTDYGFVAGLTIGTVPEPSSLILIGLGLFGVAAFYRFRPARGFSVRDDQTPHVEMGR